MKLKINPGLILSGAVILPFSILLIGADRRVRITTQVLKNGVRYAIENSGTIFLVVVAFLLSAMLIIYRNKIFDSLMEFASAQSPDTLQEKTDTKTNPL